MSETHTETRLVQIAPLGERLSALLLCEATALATVRCSLAQHGQLSALTLFAVGGGLRRSRFLLPAATSLPHATRSARMTREHRDNRST
jgi:hypothetical protein